MSKDSKAGREAKILNFHPSGEYYFTKGLKAYHKRDLNKAKKYLERAVDLEPEEPMIACQLAIICTEIGEYRMSVTLLEGIIGMDPDMSECHYFLANNYAHLGMFKEAYLHATAYLDQDEEGEFSEDAEDLLDLITFESDETEESLTIQDGLIGRQEEARGYLERGNFLKAAEVLKETIEEYEDYWSAYNNLALAYFYLGKFEDAYRTLEEVLDKNPGNLHALCNLLVFYYYQHKTKEMAGLVSVLEKVRPILIEHRFKLGTTFALTGHYELGYAWLRRLQKEGYEGDGTFYYWLAVTAYQLGYMDKAEQSWKKVVELQPEKAGLEPWGEQTAAVDGFEHHLPSILKRFESEFEEERLFAIFLTKHSIKKAEVTNGELFKRNSRFTEREKAYAEFVRTNGASTLPAEILFADETAELLYSKHHPIQFREAGLYLMWFSVCLEAGKAGMNLTNSKAWAAAVEYVWLDLRNEKRTKTETAAVYGISPATLTKYVNKVESIFN